MASGANSTFRQVGVATGIAALGAVFASQIQHRTLAALARTAAGHEVIAHGGSAIQGAILSGGVRQASAAIPSPASRTALLDAYRVGFSSTLDTIMVIGAIIAFVGSIGAFVLVRQRDFVPSVSPTGAPAPESVAEPAIR